MNKYFCTVTVHVLQTCTAVNCFFLNKHNHISCEIEYGQDCNTLAYESKKNGASINESDVAILLNEVLPSTQYWFVLTAENQTYTVKLQGQFTGELKQNNNHDYMYSRIQGRKHPQHKHICKSQHHSSSGLTVYKSKFRSYMVQEIPASIVLCKEGRVLCSCSYSVDLHLISSNLNVWFDFKLWYHNYPHALYNYNRHINACITRYYFM